MLRRCAARLLTGRVAFLAAGVLDLCLLARLALIHVFRTRARGRLRGLVRWRRLGRRSRA